MDNTLMVINALQEMLITVKFTIQPELSVHNVLMDIIQMI